ncbi:MAG: hypothetical protein R3260_03475 [Pseudomonas sp.]|nr:hypothetical protein [Pseudomonas sp.]
MAILISNFATGRLSSNILSTDTAVLLNTGEGAYFPSPTGGDYCIAVIEDTAGVKEVVHITARSGDSLTLTRAQEATTAQDFDSGSRLELRVTKGLLEAFLIEQPETGTDQTITANNAGDIPLTLKGAASQTADLFKIVDSTDTEVASIDASGNLVITGKLDSESVGFTANGTGAVERTVEARLETVVDLDDYDVAKDGVTDDTTKITNALARRAALGVPLYIPAGSYLYNSVVYVVEGPFLWYDNDFDTGVNPLASAETSTILLTGSTVTDAVLDPKKGKVLFSGTVEGKGGQHADVIRANLINYSTAGNGNTAIYARITNYDTNTNWSTALHGEARHGGGISIGLGAEMASYETTGALYGCVLNNTTSASETTHPISGAAKAECTNAEALHITGTTETTPNEDRSKWAYGIRFTADSLRSGAVGIFNQSDANTFIRDDGAQTWGLLLNGTYSSGAIRIPADSTIGFEATNAIRMRYSSTDLAIQFLTTGDAIIADFKTSGDQVKLGDDTGAYAHIINGAAATHRYYYPQSAGSTRWAWGVSSGAESGSDAGSDFFLNSYTDAGAYKDTPFRITRSNGKVRMTNACDVDGVLTVGDGTGSTTFIIDGAAGNTRGQYLRSNGSNRWGWFANTAAESGSNVGSDFTLYRYSDAGASLGLVMAAYRNSGDVRFYSKLISEGNMEVGDGTNAATTIIDGGAGTSRSISFSSAGVNRWALGTNSATESGSDVGSDLFIGGYSDAGAWLGTYITVNRASGRVVLQKGQLQFPATQNASTDANTLDDYEEGTWTPALDDATNSATLAAAEGTYTKVGNKVFIEGAIEVSSLGSMTGTTIRITGLPFVAKSSTSSYLHGCNIHRVFNMAFGAQGETAKGYISASHIRLLTDGAGTTGTTAMNATDLTASSQIAFTASYITA